MLASCGEVQTTTTLSSNDVAEETFVNPVFYKTMHPLSTGSWKTTITPLEMHEENKEGFVVKSYCKMLDNQEKYVTLKCTTVQPSDSTYTLIYKFSILDEKDPAYPNEIYILQEYCTEHEYYNDTAIYGKILYWCRGLVCVY